MFCALPLSYVIETMRPLPTEPIARAPRFVLGASIVRGVPTPVIDCAALLQQDAPRAHTRWATIRCGERVAALAFDAVVGVRALSAADAALPPLLSGAAGETIESLSTLDAQLLLVLHAGKLVPDGTFGALDARDRA